MHDTLCASGKVLKNVSMFRKKRSLYDGLITDNSVNSGTLISGNKLSVEILCIYVFRIFEGSQTRPTSNCMVTVCRHCYVHIFVEWRIAHLASHFAMGYDILVWRDEMTNFMN